MISLYKKRKKAIGEIGSLFLDDEPELPGSPLGDTVCVRQVASIAVVLRPSIPVSEEGDAGVLWGKTSRLRQWQSR